MAVGGDSAGVFGAGRENLDKIRDKYGLPARSITNIRDSARIGGFQIKVTDNSDHASASNLLKFRYSKDGKEAGVINVTLKKDPVKMENTVRVAHELSSDFKHDTRQDKNKFKSDIQDAAMQIEIGFNKLRFKTRSFGE